MLKKHFNKNNLGFALCTVFVCMTYGSFSPDREGEVASDSDDNREVEQRIESPIVPEDNRVQALQDRVRLLQEENNRMRLQAERDAADAQLVFHRRIRLAREWDRRRLRGEPFQNRMLRLELNRPQVQGYLGCELSVLRDNMQINQRRLEIAR